MTNSQSVEQDRIVAGNIFATLVRTIFVDTVHVPQGFIIHNQDGHMGIYTDTAKFNDTKRFKTRMWANAQPDGRPAEHRWRPLFNAAKFG